MQATRLDTYELTTSDQSLAQPPSKADSVTKTIWQATMQATSKTIWDYMTSDQSLAGSHIFRILKDHDNKRTIKTG